MIGIISDELSSDPEVGFKFARQNSLDFLDIRTVDKKQIYELSESELHRLKRLSDYYNIPIRVISTDICKNNGQSFDKDKQNFITSIRATKYLGTSFIRCFSFTSRMQDAEIVSQLNEINKLADKEHITVLLENDPGCNFQTGIQVSSAIEKMDNFDILWDPGNCAWCNYPLSEFEHIKTQVQHIHVKNVCFSKGKPFWCSLRKGIIDYNYLLNQIKAYPISIETHYSFSNQIDSALESLKFIKKVIG